MDGREEGRKGGRIDEREGGWTVDRQIGWTGGIKERRVDRRGG